jgi:triacylglycerol esterase/lipase EstA (alpha/beta hydrolase family)
MKTMTLLLLTSFAVLPALAACSASDEEALRAAFPEGERLLVLMHGSSMGEGAWQRKGHDHGRALATDAGFMPLYLRYNSGLHISKNGCGFAALLEQLVAAFPRPIDEIVLLAHSMGGLIARSACVIGEAEGHAWRQKLHTLVTLGTPHHGAPFERGGNWIDILLGVSRYSAPLASLGKLRSACVTDLRYGNVLDTDWQGRARFANSGDTRSPLSLAKTRPPRKNHPRQENCAS